MSCMHLAGLISCHPSPWITKHLLALLAPPKLAVGTLIFRVHPLVKIGRRPRLQRRDVIPFGNACRFEEAV